MAYPDVNTKWKENYKYQITTTVQVEGRLSYIKHLRATLLYIEENVTDEEFHQIATEGKLFPRLDTYKIANLQEI